MKQINKNVLGSRIAELRKAKGISQEVLANEIEISRPSLVQIENGNRSIDVFEMKRIASSLGFSIDELLSADKLEMHEPDIIYKVKSKTKRKRNPSEKFNFEKFKNTFIYLLENTSGNPDLNEQILFSLMYLIEFNYYETYESQLSTIQFIKRLNIPQPEKIQQLISTLINEECIIRINTKTSLQKNISRLIPLQKSNLEILKASEKQIIDNIITIYASWSESKLASYIQKDIPCISTKEGEIINFELAFYREAPYSVRSYNEL